MLRIDVARFLTLTATLAAACAGGQPAPAPSPIVAAAPTEVEIPDAGATDEGEPDAAPPAAGEPTGPTSEGDPGAEGGVAGDPLRDPAHEGGALGSAAAGAMDPADIARVFRANLSKIKACYEAELKTDPAFSTKVTAQLVIGTGGAVKSASLTRASGRQTFDSCLLARMRNLRFPAPDGGVVTVNYPFVFKAP